MIMGIEKQVCSFQYAKRLKELGVKQESLFVWEYFNDTCYGVRYIPFASVKSVDNNVIHYSAFTVAELGEMLPCKIGEESAGNTSKELCMEKDNLNYMVGYAWRYGFNPGFESTNEADARAILLIYLIENNLMVLEK